MSRPASGSRPPLRQSASGYDRSGEACSRSPAGSLLGRGHAETPRRGSVSMQHLFEASGRPLLNANTTPTLPITSAVAAATEVTLALVTTVTVPTQGKGE